MHRSPLLYDGEASKFFGLPMEPARILVVIGAVLFAL